MATGARQLLEFEHLSGSFAFVSEKTYAHDLYLAPIATLLDSGHR